MVISELNSYSVIHVDLEVKCTCVIPLRAFSPLEDPTATYVPHSPTAGLTAVGMRKDMGLFPGWRLLC